MSRARDLADGTFSGAFSADSPTLVVDDANNRVGVGIATPQKSLDVTGTFAISNSTTSYWDFDRDDSTGDLVISDTGSEKIRMLTGGGITFNGDTAAANALDDFETGSFEPTLLGSSSNPTVTYHSDTGGYYLKIGKLLYVTGAIRWSTAFSGGSGTAMIGNLPFTLAARTNGDNSDSLGVARLPAWNGSGTVSPNAVKGNQSSTTLSMQCIEIGSPTTTIQISHLGSNCMISFTAMVHTS